MSEMNQKKLGTVQSLIPGKSDYDMDAEMERLKNLADGALVSLKREGGAGHGSGPEQGMHYIVIVCNGRSLAASTHGTPHILAAMAKDAQERATNQIIADVLDLYESSRSSPSDAS